MFSVKMKLSIIILTIFVTALCFTRREMSQNVTLVTLVIPGHAYKAKEVFGSEVFGKACSEGSRQRALAKMDL